MTDEPEGGNVFFQPEGYGFVDLTFRITMLASDSSHYRFHVGANHHGEAVGFDVVLVRGMQGGFDADLKLVNDHVYRQGVRFHRSGDESDRLVSAIAALYELGLGGTRMAHEVSFTAIPLHQGELDFDTQHVTMKIFGHDEEPFDENVYYESFFHVDFAKGLAHWNEKDPEYRAPLLAGLSAP